jgi:hypothetical protein
MAHVAADFPFLLGQPVRRIDGSDLGTLIGVILSPTELAIVRWAEDTTYEPTDDLNEVSRLAA